MSYKIATTETIRRDRVLEIQGILPAGAESAKRKPNGRHYYLTA